MSWQWLASVAFAGLALSALSGCGAKPAAQNQVQGTVYFHGAPLPGGRVVFVPDTDHGGSGTLVMGKIDRSGRFAIVSTSDEPLSLGWHRVTVCGEPREEPPSQFVSLFRDVPARYRNPALSGLRCELKAGPNRIDIHLEDY